MKNHTLPAPVRDLREAHASLREDLQKLERMVGSRSAAGPEELRACLKATNEHVTEHFHGEEVDGYFEAVRWREPHRERTVQELALEHRRMAEMLAGIIAQAGASDIDDLLRFKINEWIRQIRDHEARENRLIQEVFNREFDAED